MFDVIVIGAGQAGLAMGYHLRKQTGNFLLLDRSAQVGESWRIRYDSLTLFTSRKFSSLPGLQMWGALQDCPSKDEVADYLAQYAAHFNLPVQLNTECRHWRKMTTIFPLRQIKAESAPGMS